MAAAIDRETDGKCLTDLLAEQVRARPHETAVVCGNRTLTYRELGHAARRTAACLRRRGVRREDRVGVFLDASVELMAGVWGILHTGGAYLPLSPDYPDERLRHMIEDSGIRVVFTRLELAGRLAALAPPHVTVVTPQDVEQDARHPDAAAASVASVAGRPATGPRPDSLAYVIYTSGSSGTPKGVMIEHRAAVHQMEWLRDHQGLGGDEVVLHKTPVSFDAAQWEILAPACGARVVVGEPGIHRDTARLIDTVVAHRVTTLQCVPTLLKALLDSDDISGCTSLTQIFSGGEALSRALARQCLQTLPHCTLTNLYGPTECTINASAFTVTARSLAAPPRPAGAGEGPQSVPIGTPVTGLRAHVLDGEMRPLEPGRTGELWLSGIQLARGYLGRPDLTGERFVTSPFGDAAPHDRLYRTGDLASWNTDGTLQFAGRVDNQVKLRGFRIELEEVRLAIEAHDWVKNAAVLVRDDPRTGSQNLVACLELSPREAALMDQGRTASHHLSKASRLQVRAQLSNAGVREEAALRGRPAVDLPGAGESAPQRARAFARKTYRSYDGASPAPQDILNALARRARAAEAREPKELTLDELGVLLREFGPYRSDERLLPKYAYASPGSLYATQLLLETTGDIASLAPGVYYHHPHQHRLIRVADARERVAPPGLRLHFLGRDQAVEPVYKNNIREVLEIEAGHMLGLFDEILPAHGLSLRAAPFDPDDRRLLDCPPEDHYLGSYVLAPYAPPDHFADVDVYVQIHPGSDMGLRSGLYHCAEGRLRYLTDEIVLKRHVIAINQQTYQQASFGITAVSRTGEGWRQYIDLGRFLHHLQANTGRLGLMSAGYSSRTGHDLPAARRIDALLARHGLPTGPSYFSVGGRVSEEQIAHEGMNEDTVHMKGPAELIKDDLLRLLPEFMVPHRMLVMDRLPHTANGKLDTRALTAHADAAVAADDRPLVPPRTRTQKRLWELWKSALRREVLSVQDDFFACGGNSLIAVTLVNRINREFGVTVPVQVFFEAATVEKLALYVEGADGRRSSPRLVPLSAEGDGPPVFCWPGLGGSPMNLRLVAERCASAGGSPRPVHGVQAHGLNAGESPFTSLSEMAAADVAAIRRLRPDGPYTLWGYSFGARVAYEAAWQLEQAGQRVEHLLLLAPGSPRLPGPPSWTAARADFTDDTFRTILLSVFAGTTSGALTAACLRETRDQESFARFVTRSLPALDAATVRRVIAVACTTYGWQPGPHRPAAPVTVVTARGDEASFLERGPAPADPTAPAPAFVRLDTDHYGMLRDPGVDELAKVVARHTPTRVR
ncbi:amino acid adenylation domain-containing protein [Streptomyces sp. NBC_00365]|uniref:amino acid adenylation domain-containing protein n=1 Tax=Streptomyces sp. NBC_00365 TaxID=2975726 RepID=UPI00224D4ACB|nr:amino acid adenylation domain-containing protein [Streptomyces sp. NBC_00365]MCX5096712.1 amino acid adenylation domain-containing protein [Streptomyces sp. NBC_00365]